METNKRSGRCFGNEIEDRIYNNKDYDYPNGIILEDRINEVAAEITEYLKKTGRMQKLLYFVLQKMLRRG